MESTLKYNPKYLLIGSRALDYWHDLGLVKEDTDWDIISKEPIEGAEHHPWDFLNNAELVNYTCPQDYVMFNGLVVHVVTLKGLAMVKRSHLWRDLSFGKHITHFHKHLATNSSSGILYWTAQWNDLSGKRKSKAFNTEKLGYEIAFDEAVKYRTKMIEELNAQGAGYSENHGKESRLISAINH